MRIPNRFESFLCLHPNLCNDNIISAQRPGLKMGVDNYFFWSEIRSGFEEQGSTPPLRIPSSTPAPGVKSYPTVEINLTCTAH